MGLFKTSRSVRKAACSSAPRRSTLFNHPNLGGANFNPTSSTFGKVTGKTGDVRNLQLSLRLYF